MREELAILIINANGPAVPAKLLTQGDDVVVWSDHLDWGAARNRLMRGMPWCFKNADSNSGPLELKVFAGDFIRHSQSRALIAI